jgi:hypothetical protein
MLLREVFDALEPGGEIVEGPFARLIAAGRLDAAGYEGF